MVSLSRTVLETFVRKCHIFTHISVIWGQVIFRLKVPPFLLSLCTHRNLCLQSSCQHWGASMQPKIPRAKPSGWADSFPAVCGLAAHRHGVPIVTIHVSNVNILKLEFISFPGRKLAGMLFCNNLPVIGVFHFQPRGVCFFVVTCLWRQKIGRDNRMR